MYWNYSQINPVRAMDFRWIYGSTPMSDLKVLKKKLSKENEIVLLIIKDVLGNLYELDNLLYNNYFNSLVYGRTKSNR